MRAECPDRFVFTEFDLLFSHFCKSSIYGWVIYAGYVRNGMMLKERVGIIRTDRTKSYKLDGTKLSLRKFDRLINDWRNVRIGMSPESMERLNASVEAVSKAVEDGEVLSLIHI